MISFKMKGQERGAYPPFEDTYEYEYNTHAEIRSSYSNVWSWFEHSTVGREEVAWALDSFFELVLSTIYLLKGISMGVDVDSGGRYIYRKDTKTLLFAVVSRKGGYY